MARLTRDQEYAARLLDRKGQVALRQVNQKEGITLETLEALVAAGRAERVEGLKSVYRTTAKPRVAGTERNPRSVRLEVPPDIDTKAALTPHQERVARWLDREGRCTLKEARVQGIEPAVLDALVVAGRVRLVGWPDAIYETTAERPSGPELQVQAPPEETVPPPTSTRPILPLKTRAEKDVARWLDRAREVTLRQAVQEEGIDEDVLEALVEAGRAIRIDSPTVSYLSTSVVRRRAAGQLRETTSSRLEVPLDKGTKIALSPRQEYVARWIERDGQLSLRKAIQEGIEQEILDALVDVGRVKLVPGSSPVYTTTVESGIMPDTMPAPAKTIEPKVASAIVADTSRLTRKQEYRLRWLRRAREVTLATAQRQGIDQVELDALVSVGLAIRDNDGVDPIYRAVEVGAKLRQGPEARPHVEIKPLPAPVEQKIVDLLHDGKPRSAGEVASGLLQAERDFIAMRQVGREVQRALPGLVARGHLQRIMFGIPVEGIRKTYRYEEKYISAAAVIPVCLSCFRNHWAMDAVPPQATGDQARLCAFPDCQKRTNDSAYVPKVEFQQRVEHSSEVI